MNRKINMTKIRKYLLITFISAWIIVLIGSNDVKNGGTANMMSFSYSLSLCMYTPAIGAFFAGAGISRMGWKLNLEKNYKLIIFAWLIPTVLQIAGAVLYFGVFPDDLDISDTSLKENSPKLFKELEESGTTYTAYIAKEIFYSITSFYTFMAVFSALGEEIGWRGFLFPELKKLCGRTKGVLIGGVIHGIWHFPLMLLIGYEYGTDYIGAPVLGLLAFCIFTVTTGIISDHLYEKSKSIWLPAIIHGTTNATFDVYMLGGDRRRTIFGPANIGLISMIPLAALAAWILYKYYISESAEAEEE